MKEEAIGKIKQLLLDQLDELTQRGKRTVFEISRELSKEADYIDRASSETQLAQITRLRTRERLLIKKIERALQAIDDGVFGICESCGEDIGLSRLWVRPVTTFCIDCKSRNEEAERRLGA